MATYSRFLGGAVKVQYRQGDIFLSASGTFVADSGRSIFLEQHLEQRGKRNYFRWEIPYSCVLRMEESVGAAPPASKEYDPEKHMSPDTSNGEVRMVRFRNPAEQT